MAEETTVLKHMDDEAIRWQTCAICGTQKQRIIRQGERPDFAFCDHCHSAFVLEEGGQMRMYYGQIGLEMPQTRAFALKQWRKYFEVKTTADSERTGQAKELPSELRSPSEAALQDAYSTHDDAILALEAEKADIFYSRAKKTEAPPRPLRETGALPDLDSLFKDPDER